MSEDRDRWIMLIKEIRQDQGISIYDAERLALGRPEWRRWVERQINTDMRCKRMARYHMHTHGTQSLIVKEGEKLRVRQALLSPTTSA